jgi:hypothetical protein
MCINKLQRSCMYFACISIIFTFTCIHTLCLTTTRWSWGHKNEELFCKLLEEERVGLIRLFPESSILTPSFPRGENLLLLQHSALGVPTWHTCFVSSPPQGIIRRRSPAVACKYGHSCGTSGPNGYDYG